MNDGRQGDENRANWVGSRGKSQPDKTCERWRWGMDGIWHARNNTEGKRPRGSVISGPHLGAVHCVLVQQQYLSALKRGRHSSGTRLCIAAHQNENDASCWPSALANFNLQARAKPGAACRRHAMSTSFIVIVVGLVPTQSRSRWVARKSWNQAEQVTGGESRHVVFGSSCH